MLNSLFLRFSLLILYCSFCQGIADWELHPNGVLGVLTNFSQKIRGTINSDLTIDYLIINNHSWSLLIVRDVGRFWIFSAQHSERHSYLSTVLDLAFYLTLVFRSVEYLFDLSNIFSSGNRLLSIFRISFRSYVTSRVSQCQMPRVTLPSVSRVTTVRYIIILGAHLGYRLTQPKIWLGWLLGCKY